MNSRYFLLVCCIFSTIYAADVSIAIFDRVKYAEVIVQEETTFDAQVAKAQKLLACFPQDFDRKTLPMLRYGLSCVVEFQKKDPSSPASPRIAKDLLKQIKEFADKQLAK